MIKIEYLNGKTSFVRLKDISLVGIEEKVIIFRKKSGISPIRHVENCQEILDLINTTY
jgi:hypothetical protein